MVTSCTEQGHTWVLLRSFKGPVKKVTVGDEIFLVVLFHNEITCRVLKTHRPWYTYQLTPYQVIEPEVPYIWRKIWLFDSWYEEKILAVQCCVLFLCAVSLQVVSVLTLLWKGNTKIKLLCVLHITLHKKNMIITGSNGWESVQRTTAHVSNQPEFSLHIVCQRISFFFISLAPQVL